MKHILSSLILATGLLTLAPLAVHANDFKPPCDLRGSSSVPELDPSAMSAALAVLAGGAAVLSGRRRRS